ncbi:MAG: RiPP maturation radical SAM C-methyltransferase [Pseudomonadota bacterium]
MKIALVAMPWPLFDMPSVAIGTLKAFVKRERPQHEVVTKYAYLQLWKKLGDVYDGISKFAFAEFAYMPLLFPEKRESAKKRLTDSLEGHVKNLKLSKFRLPKDWSDQTEKAICEHTEELAKELADRYDLVGFTVTFYQLFSSLALSKRIKELNPNVKIVFGGWGVGFDIGPATLDLFPHVDFIVQGEGELRFINLLDGLEAGSLEKVERSGILVGNQPRISKVSKEEILKEHFALAKTQIPELDRLPIADFDDYAEFADEHDIYWHVPIEGSRGCWWNRTCRNEDPSKACFFCGMNASTYREKSIPIIADQILAFSKKHSTLTFRFLDNVMRYKGLDELCQTILDQNKHYRFFTEARASIRPYDLMLLWEAGCRWLQIGIEGLSSSYLNRMGKGTSTIQNLQAMRLCCELEIENGGNLLVGFPGSTQDEVNETLFNIKNFAIAYPPLRMSYFGLFPNTTVRWEPERFGISNIRHSEMLIDGVPEEVARRIPSGAGLMNFDDNADTAKWDEVEKALDDWSTLRFRSQGNVFGLGNKRLFYADGGGFLEIVDRRHDYNAFTLEPMWRDVYLYCTQIRSHNRLVENFSKKYDPLKLQEILDGLTDEKLMFRENGKYLSLAVATTPQAAAKRIREFHFLETQIRE